MKTSRPWLSETLTLLVLGWTVSGILIWASCSPSEPVSRAAAPAPTPTPSPSLPTDPEVLATVGGDPVTLADFEENVRSQLASFEAQYLRQRQTVVYQTVQQVVFDRLVEKEATRRGMDKEKLLEEINHDTVVTDAEMQAWYEENKDRIAGRSYETISMQIRDYLVGTKTHHVREAFMSKFEDDVDYFVGPYRANIETEGFPALGPADAPITLVEFSDFECPYCGQFVSTLKQVSAEYGDRVRIVFRQFPLSIHPSAPKAAEASLCAHDQGKFWEMHDSMFANQRSLDVRSLKERAGQLGLDQKAFDECLDSGKHEAQVNADTIAGTIAGVTGTPSLFVNGIPTPSGAQPFEAVKAFIEDELSRLD
jgi:predicted DsbA family dithiol-disulfide isomerase